jgi:hypothetical protein
VDERYANKINYRLLKEPIDNIFKQSANKPLIIQGYIALTADERIARIAEGAGMERKKEAILLVQNFGEVHTVLD